jgi:hypothetical protein
MAKIDIGGGFYALEADTPASTAKASPLVTIQRVAGGVITWIGIYFPPGCSGLLHVQLRIGKVAIFPVIFDTYVAGDDLFLPVPVFIRTLAGWNDIRVVTYNEDDTFSHKAYVYVNVLPLEVAAPAYAFTGIDESLRRLLRRVGAP